MDTNSIQFIKNKIIDEAKKALSQYPQYKNAFDDVVLVKSKKIIKTKMGKALDKNQFTVAKKEIRSFVDLSGKQRKMLTVWSPWTQIHLSANFSDFEILE